MTTIIGKNDLEKILTRSVNHYKEEDNSEIAEEIINVKEIRHDDNTSDERGIILNFSSGQKFYVTIKEV